MTMQAPPPAAGSGWLPTLLSILGLLGGLGGVAAIGTVLVQRRKFRADAADVLTDTALTLVAPLKSRISELEADAATARRGMAAANGDLDRLRDSMRDLTRMFLKVRSEILSPDASLDRLREMVHSPPGPGEVNGQRL